MLRDYEDGVDRCPRCAWELEEGACNQCGFDATGSPFSDDDEHSFSTDYDGHDFGESEIDGDIELEDEGAFGYDFDLHHHARLPIHHEARRSNHASSASNGAISLTSDSESDHTSLAIYASRRGRTHSDEMSEDEEDEDSDEMHDFVVDDADLEDGTDHSTVRTDSPHSPISVSSSRPIGEIEYNFSTSNSEESDQDDSDGEEEEDGAEEEDEFPVAKPHRRTLRRNRIVIESSEDEDDAEPVDTVSQTLSTNHSESSEDTSDLLALTSPSPPRPAADRRAHREAQRARRRRP